MGSVVKTDEDDDPIAVMAVLNTRKYKDAAFMQQIRDFLTAVCPKAHADKLKQVRRMGPGSGDGSKW